MNVSEYLEKELVKVDNEISHYQEAVKYDNEKLLYFTHVKQHLESCIKNFSERIKEMENMLDSDIKASLAVNFPSMEDLYKE